MPSKRVKFKGFKSLHDVAAYCARHRVVLEVSYAVHKGRILPIVHSHPEASLARETRGPVPTLVAPQAG